MPVNPADMSEGIRAGDYPEWTKAQRMLLLLWNKHQEAFDSGGGQVVMSINRGPNMGVRIVHPTGVNVSDEIPELSRGGDAVAVFDRLRNEGYFDVGFGGQSPSAPNPMATFYGLTTKGLIDIGKIPDPDRRLAAALMAAHRAIEQDRSIPDPEKRDMLDTLEKMTSLMSNVRGLAQVIFQGWTQGVGNPYSPNCRECFLLGNSEGARA